MQMAIYALVPEQGDGAAKYLNTEQLLRSLGLTGKLVGFRYAIYMIERVAEDPEQIRLITKCLYRDTAKHFNATPSTVERAVRTLIQISWLHGDHAILDELAGFHLTERPSNTEFIDIMAGYLRNNKEYGNCEW